MLEAIKRFFKASMTPPAAAEPTGSRKDIRLAACALLMEIAHADDGDLKFFSHDCRLHALARSLRAQDDKLFVHTPLEVYRYIA